VNSCAQTSKCKHGCSRRASDRVSGSKETTLSKASIKFSRGGGRGGSISGQFSGGLHPPETAADVDSSVNGTYPFACARAPNGSGR
jgi:hypothetical protein